MHEKCFINLHRDPLDRLLSTVYICVKSTRPTKDALSV